MKCELKSESIIIFKLVIWWRDFLVMATQLGVTVWVQENFKTERDKSCIKNSLSAVERQAFIDLFAFALMDARVHKP